MTTLRRIFRAVETVEASEADNDPEPTTLDELARAVTLAQDREAVAAADLAVAAEHSEAATIARAVAERAFADAIAEVGLQGFEIRELIK